MFLSERDERRHGLCQVGQHLLLLAQRRPLNIQVDAQAGVRSDEFARGRREKSRRQLILPTAGETVELVQPVVHRKERVVEVAHPQFENIQRPCACLRRKQEETTLKAFDQVVCQAIPFPAQMFEFEQQALCDLLTTTVLFREGQQAAGVLSDLIVEVFLQVDFFS